MLDGEVGWADLTNLTLPRQDPLYAEQPFTLRGKSGGIRTLCYADVIILSFVLTENIPSGSVPKYWSTLLLESVTYSDSVTLKCTDVFLILSTPYYSGGYHASQKSRFS